MPPRKRATPARAAAPAAAAAAASSATKTTRAKGKAATAAATADATSAAAMSDSHTEDSVSTNTKITSTSTPTTNDTNTTTYTATPTATTTTTTTTTEKPAPLRRSRRGAPSAEVSDSGVNADAGAKAETTEIPASTLVEKRPRRAAASKSPPAVATPAAPVSAKKKRAAATAAPPASKPTPLRKSTRGTRATAAEIQSEASAHVTDSEADLAESESKEIENVDEAKDDAEEETSAVSVKEHENELVDEPKLVAEHEVAKPVSSPQKEAQSAASNTSPQPADQSGAAGAEKKTQSIVSESEEQADPAPQMQMHDDVAAFMYIDIDEADSLSRKRAASPINEQEKPPRKESRPLRAVDGDTQLRSRRMFGFLKTTLQKANEEQAQQRKTMAKRENIQSVATERQTRSTGGVSPTVKSTSPSPSAVSPGDARLRPRVRRESLEGAHESAQQAAARADFLDSIKYDDSLSRFLVTRSLPPVYWAPALHCDTTRKLLQEQVALRQQRSKVVRKVIEDKIVETRSSLDARNNNHERSSSEKNGKENGEDKGDSSAVTVSPV